MAAPDLSALVTSVDFSPVTIAILGVAAGLMLVLVAWFASQIIIATIRGEVFYNGKRYSREVWETALRDVKKEMRSGALVDKESRDAVNRYERGSVSSGRSRSGSGVPSSRI